MTSTFELTGGRLCLDLANTVGARLKVPRDDLPDFTALVSWARQAGRLSAAEARAAERAARSAPGPSRAALKRAVELRELCFDIFQAIARGESPEQKAVEGLNRWLPRVAERRRLASLGTRVGWIWRFQATDFDRIASEAAHSAVDLLAGTETSRVRECEAPTCAWLFVDESRNRSRRWCDMSSCGNRAKAKRHYQKRRKAH